ncbi:MAG: neutral/alkaline non-lysosomal ceramidase N-terminal domain-containing protein [Oscillospiraceae bacterium]
MDRQLIGFAKADITPPFSVKLAGYGSVRPSTGTHDPIYARCLVYRDDAKTTVIFALDLIAADDALCARIKNELKVLSIDEKSVNICAIHSHSTPMGVSESRHGALHGFEEEFGESDERVISLVLKGCQAACKEALACLDEYTLSRFECEVVGAGSNRTDPNLQGDNLLTGFVFEQKNGKRCLLYNYSCHPTVLAPDNLEISADLPYAVEERLKQYDEVIFINGSSGDISTRYNRSGFGFAEVERFGKIIADCIDEAEKHSEECENKEITQQFVPIELKTRQPLPLDEAEKNVERYKAQYEAAQKAGAGRTELRANMAFLEGANANLMYTKHCEGAKSYTLDCRILSIGDKDICCCPVELYSELSNRLKKNGTLFASYANGYFLYLADKKAHDNHNYEACSSPFAYGEGEHLIDEFEKELKKKA